MEKFIEVKDATRQAVKHNEQRSSSVEARQTPRVRFYSIDLLRETRDVFLLLFQSEGDWSSQSAVFDLPVQNQLKQENAHLKIALAQR